MVTIPKENSDGNNFSNQTTNKKKGTSKDTIPNPIKNSILFYFVPPLGLKPRLYALEVRCFIQLSYRGIFEGLHLYSALQAFKVPT